MSEVANLGNAIEEDKKCWINHFPKCEKAAIKEEEEDDEGL